MMLKGMTLNTPVIDKAANKIDGVDVSFNCKGEVLKQNNSVCAIETYKGGYRCCEGGMVLLDKDQVQPDAEDTYYLKVRFFYEPYEEAPVPGQEDAVMASHAHLFRYYIQTEQFAVRAYCASFWFLFLSSILLEEQCIR